MYDFIGFDDWIEIFKGGIQADSNGTEHDGDAIIEKAVAAFNTDIHEPPIVVGHPKDNTPAFGWVEKLKKAVVDGKNVLLAKLKQVDPVFEDLVKKGAYKKRSASFYSNGMLRHVGFLGGMPPSVKGLADVKFSSENENAAVFFWSSDIADETKRFSEDEVQDRVERAKKAERNKLKSEFAEEERRKQRELRNKEIEAFVKRKVEDGVIPPAIAFGGGLVEFMQGISGSPVIEFTEEEKKTPVEWMMGFLDRMDRFHIFSELATKDRAYEFDGSARDKKLGEEIAAKVNPIETHEQNEEVANDK